ncbi:MAG: putative transcriptional regulator [Acidobacteriota bacterium]|jgi:putative transcriptional regulator|nr:putative transcriptional regulator [Acidobacteriota bacterium]
MRNIVFSLKAGTPGGERLFMVETHLDELLEERGHSFYWLSKETGISHTTLWRLKKGKALGINFVTLESICVALGCQPGDVLRLASRRKAAKKRKTRSVR